MMGFIVSIILLILAISCHKKTGCWYSPGALFLYLWSLIVCFSSLHLWGIYEVSDRMYFLALVGSVAFYLGNYKTQVHIKNAGHIDKSERYIPGYVFFISIVVLVLMQVKPFIQSLLLQASGAELSEIRAEFFEQNKSALQTLIETITSIFVPLLEAYGVVMFAKDMKKNIIYLLSVIVLVGMKSVTSGGRWGLFFLLVELIICVLLFKKATHVKYAFKTRFTVISIAALLIGSIVFVSLQRGIESESMVKHYYMYLCGNMVFCDQRLPMLDNWGVFPLSVGLWGLWYLIFPYLKFLGIPYPSWYSVVSDTVMTTQDSMPIGEDMNFNAFSTPFYYLYADARWLGVIAGMFLWAKIAGILYQRVVFEGNSKSLVFFLLSCQMIFNSIFAFPFVNTGYVSILIYYFIDRHYFHKQKKLVK